MITVDAIVSGVNALIYVGIAKDPDKRLKEHNSGKSKFTKGFRPWRTMYRELQPDWKTARKEKYI